MWILPPQRQRGLLEFCQLCYQLDIGRSPMLLVLGQNALLFVLEWPGELIARLGASILLMTHTLGFCVAMVNSRVEAPTVAVMGGTTSRSCAGCGGRIADRFLLFSMEQYWHTRCLKCSCCHAQLGEYSSTCYSKGGMILCRNDYIRLFGHSGACSACGQSIPASEMVMRTQGNVYHLKCFICATCRNRLVPGDRFHYINGTIFCEHDRPGGGLLGGHPTQMQANGIMSDQKVC